MFVYYNLKGIVDGIIASEEELEENILKSIEQSTKQIHEMCFELQVRFDDLKPLRSLNTMSTLDKDDVLRKEAKRLQAEKKKRMDEYKVLINQEQALCDKLVVKRGEVRMHVPSEAEIHALIKRVEDLRKLYEDRKREMNELKSQILALHDDLEISQSDSFTEQLLFEKIEDVIMGEMEVSRARDFRDSLVRKNNEIIDQIR
jgi:hypothetical protein